MQSIQLHADYIRGAVSVETVEGGLTPFRLRSADRDLLHPELIVRAEMASGVRLECVTDAKTMQMDLTWTGEEDPDNRRAMDLVIDGNVIMSHTVEAGRQTLTFDNLPGNGATVQLWLPQFGRTILHGLMVNDDATIEPIATPTSGRWVTYGSSITHCRQAHSPARTWPAVVARTHRLHLTSLGFGGQCQFDPLVARTMAKLPADCISMKLGINTHGGPSFHQRTWQQAVIGMVLTVRDQHPDTPLLIVSPIYSFARETEAPATGWTLPQMRDQLANVVEKFRARGDTNIHYLDGLRLLGAEDAHLLPDQLHPNGEGYERMGQRFGALAFAANGPLANHS